MSCLADRLLRDQSADRRRDIGFREVCEGRLRLDAAFCSLALFISRFGDGRLSAVLYDIEVAVSTGGAGLSRQTRPERWMRHGVTRSRSDRDGSPAL